MAKNGRVRAEWYALYARSSVRCKSKSRKRLLGILRGRTRDAGYSNTGRASYFLSRCPKLCKLHGLDFRPKSWLPSQLKKYHCIWRLMLQENTFTTNVEKILLMLQPFNLSMQGVRAPRGRNEKAISIVPVIHSKPIDVCRPFCIVTLCKSISFNCIIIKSVRIVNLHISEGIYRCWMTIAESAPVGWLIGCPQKSRCRSLSP